MLVADAQQALALSDKQYPEFITRLRALQETRRANLIQRVKLMADSSGSATRGRRRRPTTRR